MNGNIGGGALIKQGGGTLSLSGTTNDYQGGTSINEGTIAITNGSALGTGNINLNSGGKLLGTETLTVSNKLVINGGQTGTLAAAAGTTLTFKGMFSLNWDLGSGGNLIVGSATDTGTVLWDRAGEQVGVGMGVTNTLTVAGGTLRAANDRLSTLPRLQRRPRSPRAPRWT